MAKEYSIELEKLNATKDRFFSIIAHDLRNPFAGLMYSTQGLLKNLRKLNIDELEEYITTLYETSKRGNELLENLLEWSKSQRDKITVVPTDIVLKAIINERISLINPQANAKKITIQNKVPDDLILRTDENLVKTILRNLLANAVKFTFESGLVTIISETLKDYIAISIIDTGTGMSKIVQDKLFRIDSNNCSKPGTLNETGTGLGLIVCMEFIEKLGGTIRVQSEEGKGSTFKFTIPTEV